MISRAKRQSRTNSHNENPLNHAVNIIFEGYGTLTSAPLSYSSNMNERLQAEMFLSTIITSFSTQDYLYVHEEYVNDYQMYFANITQLHCIYRHYLYGYKCTLPSPITNMLRIDGYVHHLTKIFIRAWSGSKEGLSYQSTNQYQENSHL